MSNTRLFYYNTFKVILCIGVVDDIGKILFVQLLAKECARDPANNMDIICVSLMHMGKNVACAINEYN